MDRELSRSGRARGPERLEEIAGKLRSPSSSAAAHERERALESALSQLPEHYRRVLHLRHQEKLTYAQIGATLNCSAESARKLWGRALNCLQKLLRPEQAPS